MINVSHLTRTYPGDVPIHALRDVSFHLNKGELVAIMGRSGSGKSTLLHQIGLIDTPTSGKIMIGGEDVLALSDKEKTRFRLTSIGFIFQEYALIPELTAWENVYLPAMAEGNDVKARKHHAKELLELVGLGHRLRHYPSELSGGEQQRVAVARALVNNPKVLLADEPTANLDSASARVVLELFRRLNRELNQTILLITHEPEDKEFVDRILWLSDGVLDRVENVPKSVQEMRKILAADGTAKRKRQKV
ncbi:ABC transporter ATP-binding protein [Candidatus Uhrbacteria bacterium]|nr:ABC transporter ATP-binding protein [Candidatus Uhrbacteria bacterium]